MKTKFQIKIIYLILLMVTNLLIGSLGQAQGSECTTALKGWVLVPPNVEYWGTYKCNSCTLETSSKPDSDKVTRCEHCGKPHNGEPFIAPLTQQRGGELYVLNPSGFGATKEAKSGLKWKCPSCQNTVFRTEVKCPTCSTPQPSDIKNHLVNDQGEFVNQNTNRNWDDLPTASKEPSVVDIAKVPRASLTEADWRSGLETPKKSWKGWVTIGSTVLAAVTATAIYWGSQTFSERGFVSEVNNQEITIKYDHDGQMHSFNLEPEALKTEVTWHTGEAVTLHFSNFYWLQHKQANGIERSNAEVYAPILMEREAKP